jgi:hypothetical protein
MAAESRISKMLEALVICEEHADGKRRPCEGEVPCPLCGGRLMYRYGSTRMSFRMYCETENCLKAMS